MARQVCFHVIHVANICKKLRIDVFFVIFVFTDCYGCVDIVFNMA